MAWRGLTSVVCPAFEPHFIVALFPDEERPRDDICGPFELIKPPEDWLKPPLAYGLEDYVCVTGIADVEPGVGGTLHVLGRGVKHDEHEQRTVVIQGEEDRMCTSSSTAKEQAYIR